MVIIYSFLAEQLIHEPSTKALSNTKRCCWLLYLYICECLRFYDDDQNLIGWVGIILRFGVYLRRRT